MGTFTRWVREFEAEAERRRCAGDPDWGRGAWLDPAVVASVQRFQVGESGDGRNLIGKAEAAGDRDYAAAVRMFVAEEQNHARMLGALLAAANAPTIAGHWSDSMFVWLRRALGLRLELMVLLIAEVIALRYYRALRDGTGDRLTTEVAGRILADEQRHVPFHCRRLRSAFARTPRPVRWVVTVGWRVLLLGTAITVAWDHRAALRRFGVGRWEFVVDVVRLFKAAVADIAPA